VVRALKEKFTPVGEVTSVVRIKKNSFVGGRAGISTRGDRVRGDRHNKNKTPMCISVPLGIRTVGIFDQESSFEVLLGGDATSFRARRWESWVVIERMETCSSASVRS